MATLTFEARECVCAQQLQDYAFHARLGMGIGVFFPIPTLNRYFINDTNALTVPEPILKKTKTQNAD